MFSSWLQTVLEFGAILAEVKAWWDLIYYLI